MPSDVNTRSRIKNSRLAKELSKVSEGLTISGTREKFRMRVGEYRGVPLPVVSADDLADEPAVSRIAEHEEGLHSFREAAFFVDEVNQSVTNDNLVLND